MYVCDMPLKIEDSFCEHVCVSVSISVYVDIFQKNDKSMHVYIVISQVYFTILKKMLKGKTHLISKLISSSHEKQPSPSSSFETILCKIVSIYTHTYTYTYVNMQEKNIDTNLIDAS